MPPKLCYRWQGRSDDQVQRVAELAEMMGADVHIQTDYGDEVSGRTPWELFNETDARRSVGMGEEAVHGIE
jgi:hypothetical protein